MTAKTEPLSQGDLRALLLDYLDYYREEVVSKVAGMPEADVRGTMLPSGWTPAQMLNHLAFMEQRWLVSVFEGREVDDLWGDWDGDQWGMPTATTTELVDALVAAGRVTRGIVEARGLDERAAERGRFTDETAPRLHWIMLHVLQEYARHAGHLDIVREFSDDSIGRNSSSPGGPLDGMVSEQFSDSEKTGGSTES